MRQAGSSIDHKNNDDKIQCVRPRRRCVKLVEIDVVGWLFHFLVCRFNVGQWVEIVVSVPHCN